MECQSSWRKWLGANEVVIDYSIDGINWVELGQYNFPQAPEANDYEGFTGPDFGGLYIEKILVTIINTHDEGSCVSLAELQFKIDTTGCYGIIDVCGVCDGPGELTWYLDADNDGLGDINNAVDACTQPEGYVEDNTDICDNGFLGWSDIAPIFSENGCNNCHGGSASGGLDLRSFATTAAGGDICGTDLLTGTKLVDIINISGYSGCGTPIPIPSMNERLSEQLDADEMQKIQDWIDGGAPEFCTEFIVSSTHELADTEIKIYPNPALDIINIDTEGQLNIQVKLYDIQGKLLKSVSNVNQLSVKALPFGTYVLEIQDLETKQKVVERIVVGNKLMKFRIYNFVC